MATQTEGVKQPRKASKGGYTLQCPQNSQLHRLSNEQLIAFQNGNIPENSSIFTFPTVLFLDLLLFFVFVSFKGKCNYLLANPLEKSQEAKPVLEFKKQLIIYS